MSGSPSSTFELQLGSSKLSGIFTICCIHCIKNIGKPHFSAVVKCYCVITRFSWLYTNSKRLRNFPQLQALGRTNSNWTQLSGGLTRTKFSYSKIFSRPNLRYRCRKPDNLVHEICFPSVAVLQEMLQRKIHTPAISVCSWKNSSISLIMGRKLSQL